MGFQRFGVGIGIARTALRRNRQPEPLFDVQPNWVRCVLKTRPGGGEGSRERRTADRVEDGLPSPTAAAAIDSTWKTPTKPSGASTPTRRAQGVAQEGQRRVGTVPSRGSGRRSCSPQMRVASGALRRSRCSREIVPARLVPPDRNSRCLHSSARSIPLFSAKRTMSRRLRSRSLVLARPM